MNIIEGKDLIQECLTKYDSTLKIDDLIVYKTGNKRIPDAYQDIEIKADVSSKEIKPSTKYVVKCFYYMDIYAAWFVEVGRGRGKYICYKNDIQQIFCESNGTFKQAVEGHPNKPYLFKGREGVMTFVQEVLLNEELCQTV